MWNLYFVFQLACFKLLFSLFLCNGLVLGLRQYTKILFRLYLKKIRSTCCYVRSYTSYCRKSSTGIVLKHLRTDSCHFVSEYDVWLPKTNLFLFLHSPEILTFCAFKKGVTKNGIVPFFRFEILFSLRVLKSQ